MIKVAEMPFYWRFKDSPGTKPTEPPSRVPFVFDYDPALDLLIEKRSASLTKLLSDVYSRNANVGFLQDGHSLIQSYGADFWEFLERLLADFPARTVLEIGCGGCVLLERLKNRGCRVIGVDPSPFAAEAGKRKGIEILQEFFPPKALGCTPNLIFQVDVLEHIENPLHFLKAQAECLTDDGLIVVNVPDCSRSIERGDISMALHQHVNMFDAISLPTVFRAAGLEVVRLERSKYGSALYCAARKSHANPVLSSNDGSRWVRYQSLAKKAIESFQTKVNDVRRKQRTIGFFMPQRAFPFLGTMGWFDGYRVFDNMNMWHRRYLDGLKVPIENQEDLLASPVDHLFIMSLTFGEEVANPLRRDLPQMEITTLSEILCE